MGKIKSIVRTIYQSYSMSLKVLVLINEDVNSKTGYVKKPFRKWFDTYKQTYSISYQYMSMVSFDFNKSFTTKDAYNNDNKFNCPVHQIWKLIRLFNQILSDIDNDDIFYHDGDIDSPNEENLNYSMYQDAFKKYHYIEKGFLGQKIVHVMPALYSPNNMDIFRRGIHICVDSNEVGTILSLEDAFDILYLLQSTDFISLSENMIATSTIIASSDILSTSESSSANFMGNQNEAIHMSYDNAIILNPASSNPLHGLRQRVKEHYYGSDDSQQKSTD